MIISDKIWERLLCTCCGKGLARIPQGAICSCGQNYSFDSHGALDLRPIRSVTRSTRVDLGKDSTEVDFTKFRLLTDTNCVDTVFKGMKMPLHLAPEMMSHFPLASDIGELILDLGCGHGSHKQVCEVAGFTWVGIDYSAFGAPILADAHALPFATDSFGAIISIAVLEHVTHPWLMLTEAFRVLKPGGRLMGTVAFLEPHHQDSHFHHSHLAVYSVLLSAGFSIQLIAPVPKWPGLKALAQMKLFPGMPKAIAWAMLAPVQMLHIFWWRIGRLIRSNATDITRQMHTSGSFFFTATKPVMSPNSFDAL